MVVTTGMDGLFPAGLQVGIVKNIIHPQSGGSYLDTEVEPMIPEFDRLRNVTILPSIDE
jgi:cell shape-determining protein MreC